MVATGVRKPSAVKGLMCCRQAGKTILLRVDDHASNTLKGAVHDVHLFRYVGRKYELACTEIMTSSSVQSRVNSSLLACLGGRHNLPPHFKQCVSKWKIAAKRPSTLKMASPAEVVLGNETEETFNNHSIIFFNILLLRQLL